MIACSIVMGVAGIGLIFLPQETALSLAIDSNRLTIVILQMAGALYLGFAFLNWMTKDIRIGGIYGRPVVIGNLVHFLVTSLILIKTVPQVEHHFNIVLGMTILYVIFTLGFGYLPFTNPKNPRGV